MVAALAPDLTRPNGPDTSGRQRLVADRFRRVWAIAETVAAEPGHSRRELADHFHLSERQVQADLNLMRVDMRLPLVRVRGYRIADEGGGLAGPGGYTLPEALILVGMAYEALRSRWLPADDVRPVVRKLAQVVQPHLRPLVARLLEHADATGRHHAMLALASIITRQQMARLSLSVSPSEHIGSEPIVRPELLIPYLESWYVVAELGYGEDKTRTVMVNIDAVTAVTLVAP